MEATHADAWPRREPFSCFFDQEDLNDVVKEDRPVSHDRMWSIINILQLVDPSWTNMRSDNGISLLRLAVCSGHADCVQHMIQARADVSSKEGDGWSVIHAACRTQRTKPVMVEESDDSDAKGKGKGKPRLVKRTRRSGKPPFSWRTSRAPRHRQWEIARALIAAYCDVNSHSDDCVTPLMCAARSGDEVLTQALLDARAELSINQQDTRGCSALAHATMSAPTRLRPRIGRPFVTKGRGKWAQSATREHVPTRQIIVTLLLNKRADVKATIGPDKCSLIDFLVQHTCKPELRENFSERRRRLWQRVEAKERNKFEAAEALGDVVQLLLASGACASRLDSLNLAVRSGSISLTRSLLIAGMCPTSAFSLALQMSVKKTEYNWEMGRHGIAALLFSNRADPNGTDEFGVPCLIAVIVPNRADVPLFDSVGAAKSFVWRARTCNNRVNQLSLDSNVSSDSVQWLLEQTTRPDSCYYNISALMFAIVAGDLLSVKSILRSRADTSHTDDAGRNALHYTVMANSRSLVKAVLSFGKRLALARDAGGKTPLMLAMSLQFRSLSEVLIPYSSMTTTSLKGRAVLMYAIEFADASMVELVVNARADVLQRDHNFFTALHCAARVVEPAIRESIAILFQARCDVGMSDRHGRTAIHYAAALGNSTALTVMLEMSVQEGVNTHSVMMKCDRRGKNALTLAAQGGHTTCVSLLLQNRAFETRGSGGRSALVSALPRWPVLKLLLAASMDANVNDALIQCSSMEPKSLTDMLSMKACIEGLLASGASSNATDENGFTCLMLACRWMQSISNFDAWSKVPILSKLLDQNSRASALVRVRFVCGSGYQFYTLETTDEAKLCVEQALREYGAHAELDCMLYDGIPEKWSRFYTRCCTNLMVIRELLEMISGEARRTRRGWSFFLFGERENPWIDGNLFDVFLNHGYDVSYTDYDGRNLLHHACSAPPSSTCARWIPALLEAGVQKNITDHDGFTPVMYAISAGSYEAVYMVIANETTHHTPTHTVNIVVNDISLMSYLKFPKVWIDNVLPFLCAHPESNAPSISEEFIDFWQNIKERIPSPSKKRKRRCAWEVSERDSDVGFDSDPADW